MIVYVVAGDALSPGFPLVVELEVFFRRRRRALQRGGTGDEPELAAILRIE